MTRRRLPSLTALRSFEAVARTLNFTKAARELGVTQAAVSRQVKALEEQLQVKLLTREARRNLLTDAGEILFGSLYQAFGTIEQSVAKITGSGARDILNVSVAPFFSARWLTPRLMGFFERHPDIELRLHHSYHPADHKREGIDIGINWGTGDWPGVKIEKVLDGSLIPVISPKLRSRKRPLKAPAELLGLTLFYEFDVADWRLWLAAARLKMKPQTKTLRLNDTHALRRAALDGHGVALLFADLVREDVAAGRLVAPFQIRVPTGNDYFLNYPADIELTRKGKAFRRWIIDEIQRQPFA